MKKNLVSFNIIKQQLLQQNCINLIASENYVSNDVARQRSSRLCDKYILSDFPNTQGLRDLQTQLANDLTHLFGADRVNTSPISGLNCMELIINSLSNPSDHIYVLNPMCGGHSSTQTICSLFGLKVHFLNIDFSSNLFDCTAIERQFQQYPPKLVYLDYALILYYTPITDLSNLIKKYKGVLVYDGSHVLGLIAGKAFPNPLAQGADILCGSTHKTFFGTQKAIILSNNAELMNRIDHVSVDYISHTHTGETLGLLYSTIEMKMEGKSYASQVIKNSNALANMLSERGIRIAKIPNKPIETHQVWIDVDGDVSEAYSSLERCHINVNAMRIPLLKKDGLRLGTAFVTRLGMKEKEMFVIANLIADALLHKKSQEEIVEEVECFCDEYSISSILENPSMVEERFKMHSIDCFYLSHVQYAEKYCSDYLSSIPEFCGMILRGGVGRGTADIYSDIDFTAIFNCQNIEDIVKKNHLHIGMHKYKGICFSGRYISLNDFSNGHWSPKMKHAYQFVKLVNCTKSIEDIIVKHVLIDEREQLRRVLSNIIEIGEISKLYDNYKGFDMYSEIYKQFARKEYLSANLEIDRGVRYVKNIIFDLNRIHYPEEKSYYISFFSNLPNQPDSFDEKVKSILEMERTPESICQRLFEFRNLAKSVISYAEQFVNIPNDMYNFYMNNL